MGKDKLGHLGCIITVFFLMALNLDLRTQMLLTLLSFGVVLAAYVLPAASAATSRAALER